MTKFVEGDEKKILKANGVLGAVTIFISIQDYKNVLINNNKMSFRKNPFFFSVEQNKRSLSAKSNDEK